ncbi:hypothetical protein CP533_0550 [Ophiocordyceps camponoti-saundersi (nom. inval.)]|nr:hypothetical protein CP533_0550 [Ophiocordyceps camponoti-saundersi (nom. inval.)]
MSSECKICKKGPPEITLKKCGKCQETWYCSTECQKKDWKDHKKTCGGGGGNKTSSTASPTLSPPKGLDKGIDKPFTKLDNHTWLHERLRVEDMYKLEGDVSDDTLYGGAQGVALLRDFRRFLAKVERCPQKLLPAWWDGEKKEECEKLAMSQSQWHDLHSAVEKSDIIEHYGDSQFPMQLRMFAETVYGSAPGGTNGSSMRKFMMAKEGGGLGDMVTSHLDVSSFFAR